jgi:hypothetical protein
LLLALLSLAIPAGALDAQTKKAEPPAAAVIETTLKTEGKQIRQFAFDGDPGTYFLSAQNPTGKDHFTLVFDKPVAVTALAMTTGRPGGGDLLEEGSLEGSEDGKAFEPLAKFAKGVASLKLKGRQLRAVRLKPAADLKHPLAIREIVIESNPSLTIFKYPVEFIVNVDDAPEMKEWAEKAARICERQYGMINEELRSDGFKPRTVVTMTLKKDYKGVAATGGGRITGSVTYFKRDPEDVGAMVHETVHVVQAYRRGNNPGWLVEGIADYVRFFKYEPGKLGKISPKRARYNGSYRVSAAFLAYLTEKYDREIVRRLNQVMRAGEYTEAIFKKLTGKSVEDLDKEWRATLESKQVSLQVESSTRGLQ